VSDKLRTFIDTAGSPVSLHGRRFVVAAAAVAAIACAVPALAQALVLDNTLPDTTSSPTDNNAIPMDTANIPADTNPTPTDSTGTPTDTNPGSTDTGTTTTGTPSRSGTSTHSGGGTANRGGSSTNSGNTKHSAGGSNRNVTSVNRGSKAAPAVDVLPVADTGGPSALLVALIALAALLAGAIPGRVVTRRILRRRRRLAWQLQAHSEPPRRPCSKRSHYCEKTSIKLKPGRRDIAYLDLHARNGDAEEVETRASSQVVDELNGALRDYRRERKLEELRATLLPTAERLVEEIEAWLRDDTVQREITTEAHLTAAEVEYEFTLYRCSKNQDAPGWEKEDQWQASLEDEEDEDVAHLHRPRPATEDLDGLSAQLADFVTGVDVRPSLEMSSKPAPTR
jgi:hypothetical protein